MYKRQRHQSIWLLGQPYSMFHTTSLEHGIRQEHVPRTLGHQAFRKVAHSSSFSSFTSLVTSLFSHKPEDSHRAFLPYTPS